MNMKNEPRADKQAEKQANIIIKNATIVTVNPEREILENHSLVISGDRISAIGPAADITRQFETGSGRPAGATPWVIDASGSIVFPGLVNTHNHLFQVLLKGLGDDKVLSEWYTGMTAPSSRFLTEEGVYRAAMGGCLELINSGATTNADYMYPHPIPHLGDAVVKAYKKMGMRGILGRGMLDCGEDMGVPKEIMQDPKTLEKDAVRLLDTYHNTENGRIKVWLAPAAGWLVSDKMLRVTWEIAQNYNTGYTIHVSETPFDRESTMKLHGVSDAELLQKYGIVGPNVLMVHCVWLTDRDIRMAKYYDMKVSHNPVSNMYLASGVPPIPKLLSAGVTVGLAVDGAASNNTNDMLEVVRVTPLMQKVHTCDPTILTAFKVLEMATIDGARALGLENETGSLETGKKADLFIYNPRRSAKSVPMHHPVSTLVYSGSEKCVETVVIDGRVVKENGKLTVANEDEIITRVQQEADTLADKAGTAHLKRRPWMSTAF